MAVAKKKGINYAEEQRLAIERTNFAHEVRKIEESKKASQNYLTMNELITGSIIFIALAVAIILFFKTTS